MCEIGKSFSNVSYYNKEMQKGMEDKLFFIDKLPKNEKYIFIDFGCADGTMINVLSSIFDQNNIFIGYDISETMIDIAKTNYHGPIINDVTFTNNWKTVESKMKNNNYKTVLILSSVIHEVYSYSTLEGIKDFWNKVKNSKFDYVIIRDMCPSKDIINVEIPIELHDKILYNHNKEYDKQLREFEERWGSVWYMQNTLHFLLKYRWKINWERELNENYFPITVEDLLFKLIYDTNGLTYKIDYLERFRVPFLDKCFKEDFNIELTDYTHIKAIFSLNHDSNI